MLFSIFSINLCFGQDKIKIGLLFANTLAERWHKDRQYFEKVVNDMGGIVYFDSASNEKVQIIQALQMFNRGIKVLVVVPSNGDSAAFIVEEAHKHNIIVVAYDRLIKNCNLDYYISYDSKKVGELQANYIIKQKHDGNFMIINGPLSDNNSLLIKQGQMGILNSYVSRGAINIVFDKAVKSWSREDAFNIVNDFLDKTNKKPTVILVANDDMAIGVINALKKYGLEGKVLVTGQDADLESCRQIVAGNQIMTVYKPIKPLAFTAAMAVMNIAQEIPVSDAVESVNNGKVMVPSVILTPFIVDKNNLRTNIIADGHLKEADIFGK